MNKEQAAEITLAMIREGRLSITGKNNTEIAESIAEFYNALLLNTNEKKINEPIMSMDEIRRRIEKDIPIDLTEDED